MAGDGQVLKLYARSLRPLHLLSPDAARHTSGHLYLPRRRRKFFGMLLLPAPGEYHINLGGYLRPGPSKAKKTSHSKDHQILDTASIINPVPLGASPLAILGPTKTPGPSRHRWWSTTSPSRPNFQPNSFWPSPSPTHHGSLPGLPPGAPPSSQWVSHGVVPGGVTGPSQGQKVTVSSLVWTR